MRFSIRYQLLLPLLALMLGLVGVSAWSAWSSGERARRQIEKQIDDIGKTINSVSFPLAQTLHMMKGLTGAEFVLREGPDKVISTLPQVPESLPAPGGHPTQHFDKPVRIGGEWYLCGGVPWERAPRPGAILYNLYPESLMREAVWQALRPALYLGIVGGLISLFLSVLLMLQFTWRIQALERRTRLIADGDFSPMPQPSLNDELRDLGRSVNEMAQRLAQFQDAIRQTERLRLLGQVSGGLAHQLRNGVAGARLAVQLHAQDCPAPPDTDALTVALRQLALVEMHLKKFLDLGKAIDLQRLPVRLDDVLRETIALLGPQCRHAQIDLRIVEPTPVLDLIGDPVQLGHLFLNVLTNAQRGGRPKRLGRGALGGDGAASDSRDSRFGAGADAGSRCPVVRALRHRQARRGRPGPGGCPTSCRRARRRHRLAARGGVYLLSH